MKKIEWIIAAALVVIGLSCLTMFANWLGNSCSLLPDGSARHNSGDSLLSL